jgi:hypothetical protein
MQVNVTGPEAPAFKAQPVPIDWNPFLPVYASEAFLRETGSDYGWIGGSDSLGRTRCVLPYTILHKVGFRIVRFRVETIPLTESFTLAEEESFLLATMDYFRSVGADMIMPATNNAIFRTYPPGALAAPYGTFIKELNRPEEVLLNEISPDYRKNIRRAIKAGVQIDKGLSYLDEVYDLIAETLKRSNLRFKQRTSFKEEIVRGLGENVMIAVAKHNGNIQACMIAPFSQFSGYSWYSGTITEPVKGAMHLLQWEVLRKLAQMGVARFNFTGVRIRPEVGSKQEGIANFKMRFGGKRIEGYMWKYGLRPLKYAAYSAAVRLLKGGDIVDREHRRMALAR